MPRSRPRVRVLANPTRTENLTAAALTYLRAENICSDLRCLKSLREDNPVLVIHQFPNQRPLSYKVCRSCANTRGKSPTHDQNYSFPKDPAQLQGATNDPSLIAKISESQRGEVWALDTCAACAKRTSCRQIYYWLEYWSGVEEGNQEINDQSSGGGQLNVDDKAKGGCLPRVEDGHCYVDVMCNNCYSMEKNTEAIRVQRLEKRLDDYGIDSSFSGLGKGEGWLS